MIPGDLVSRAPCTEHAAELHLQVCVIKLVPHPRFFAMDHNLLHDIGSSSKTKLSGDTRLLLEVPHPPLKTSFLH